MPIFLKTIILPLLFFLSCFYSISTAEQLSVSPFNIGEELTYEISWFGINAGTGKLHVKDKVVRDGREMFHIAYSATSSELFSRFYKVEDIAETFMDTKGFFPWSFKLKVREGKNKRDVETIFDQVGHTAKFIKGKDEPKVISTPPAVQDAFSSLYYLRTKNLKVGEKVVIDVFEDKKNWQVEVSVLKRERIKIYSGEVDTVLVKPLLKFEGIFQRKGDLYIWLTDDERKIPVQVKTKVIIGSVYAKIIDVNGVRVIAPVR
jgi:hypothetical protein